MTTKHSTPSEHKLHSGNYHKRINKCKEICGNVPLELHELDTAIEDIDTLLFDINDFINDLKDEWE